ncbi:importin beta-like protein Kap120p [Trichomonascus vanleenenianus]|uniref:karyopherin KAP120 n=1 Tax=Trichomonascus vanleenenianus TaxID=2268995 RepID=UPI003ECAECA7
MTAGEVIGLLEAAASPDNHTRTSAELALKQLETQQGFLSVLQDVFLDRARDSETRLRACIMFKNVVSKTWRRSSSTIDAESKSRLRGRLFDLLGEPNRVLNEVNATATAMIVRFDFVHEWTTVFDDLHGVVAGSSDQVVLYNAYRMMYHVVKTLSKVKIGRQKSEMQARLGGMKLVATAIGHYQEAIQAGEAHLDLAIAVLKFLAVAVVEGMDQPHEHAAVCGFFRGLVDQYAQLIQTDYSDNEPVKKLVKTMGKLFNRLAREQPSSFLLMDRAPELVKSAVMNENNDEGTQVRSLRLLDSMVKVLRGIVHMRRRTDGDRTNAEKAREVLTNDILTPELTHAMSIRLMQRYLHLTESDLELWQSDPEDFFVQELHGSAWEYQLRACASTAFSDLLIAFVDDLGPMVLQAIQETTENPSASVVELETALHALQLGATPFADKFDFDNFFSAVVVPKITQNMEVPEFVIVQRRVCILVTEWIPIAFSDENKDTMYHMLLTFLSNSNDLVLQLSCMECLRYMVDDFRFDPSRLLPFAQQFLEHLFRLFALAEDQEVKVELLKVLDVIIEQLGSSFAPYAGTVLAMIPQFWQDESFRAVTINILSGIVSCNTDGEVDYYPVAVPLLKEILDPDNYDHMLFEDVLPLWRVIVSRAEEAQIPELLPLFPYLLQGIVYTSELLPDLLKIADEYVLLCYEPLLATYGKQLLSTLAEHLPSLNSYAISTVCASLDMVILVVPPAVYGPLFVETGLLNVLYQQTTAENIESTSLTELYSLFARIAYHDASAVWQQAHQSESWWQKWLDQFDRVGSPSTQKVFAMGITCMCRLADPKLLERLGQVVGIWQAVLDSEQSVEEATNDSWLSESDKEKMKMDPAYQVPLRGMISNLMQELHGKPVWSVAEAAIGQDMDKVSNMCS